MGWDETDLAAATWQEGKSMAEGWESSATFPHAFHARAGMTVVERTPPGTTVEVVDDDTMPVDTSMGDSRQAWTNRA